MLAVKSAMVRRLSAGLVVGIAAAGLMLAAPTPAVANWLTKILSEAGEVGGKGALRGAHHLDPELRPAFSQLKSLPETPDQAALVAHAGQEGHWRFVNRDGETFTAGTPDELARMREALLPGNSKKLALYLTPDTVFAQRRLLDDLPKDADLFIVARKGHHKLLRDGDTLLAEVRPGLRVRLDDPDLFNELLFQIAQPLKPASMRILALETGSADALPAVPRFDMATRAALIDRIDPQRLITALSAIRGQTAVLTARIEGNALKFIDAAGGEKSLPLDAVRKAAREADVNLVIVKAKTPRQPGGRNWLWQTTSIPGLDTALKQPAFGDFLASLAGQSGPLTVTGRTDGFGRVVLEALPPPSSSAPLTSTLTDWVDALAGDVMARIAAEGIEADVRNEERQSELDRRIIPGLNSWVQIGYLVSLGMGLFGVGTAWRWFGRVWPPEDRGEYRGRIGYAAARAVRGVMFGLVFLPLIGLPLFVRYIGLQIWGIVTAPFRAARWLWGRVVPRAG